MDEQVKEKVWNNIFQKIEDKGYDSLNEHERIWFNVDGLIGYASNGGLISFFYNDGAEYYKETIEDLHAIGAKNAASLLNKIAGMFPGGEPSADIDERNEVIDSWNHDELSDFFESLDNEFYAIVDDIEKKLEPSVIRAIEASCMNKQG